MSDFKNPHTATPVTSFHLFYLYFKDVEAAGLSLSLPTLEVSSEGAHLHDSHVSHKQYLRQPRADSLHLQNILTVSFEIYCCDVQNQNDDSCVTVQILVFVKAGLVLIFAL